MPLSTFGHVLPGFSRFGDGSYTFIRPLSSSITVSYTITLSKYTSSIPVSYVLEKPHVSPFQIYYQIQPPTEFAINGDATIIKPDHVTYTPLPVVGHTLLGSPLMQGYQLMTWLYSLIRWDEYAHILSFYQAQQPEVQVNYPDHNGIWQQKNLIMRPPVFGTQQQFILSNVSLIFLVPLS